MLCLEERESAISRGATILGEITGYANFSDAFDFTSPAEDCVARVKTIEMALQQAEPLLNLSIISMPMGPQQLLMT